MNPELSSADGSMLWQTIFISFAVLLILFELIRGWRFGLMRQLTRVCAVVAAYAAAIFGGQFLLPIARPFLRMPDSIIAILAGAVLALLVYSIISSLGVVLFKRTAQQESAPARLFNGVTGAAVGVFFGAFLVWLVVVGVRSVGSIADGQVQAQSESPSLNSNSTIQAVHTSLSPSPTAAERKAEQAPVMTALARLKNSIELGSVGEVVKQADIMPSKTYELLAQVGYLLGSPENAERFLEFPGARELSENPKILALRNDHEITDLIARGRLFDLLQNEKILDAANDPALIAEIRKFNLRQALDYALQTNK